MISYNKFSIYNSQNAGWNIIKPNLVQLTRNSKSSKHMSCDIPISLDMPHIWRTILLKNSTSFDNKVAIFAHTLIFAYN
jgi:hypothetical protein